MPLQGVWLRGTHAQAAGQCASERMSSLWGFLFFEVTARALCNRFTSRSYHALVRYLLKSLEISVYDMFAQRRGLFYRMPPVCCFQRVEYKSADYVPVSRPHHATLFVPALDAHCSRPHSSHCGISAGHITLNHSGLSRIATQRIKSCTTAVTKAIFSKRISSALVGIFHDYIPAPSSVPFLTSILCFLSFVLRMGQYTYFVREANECESSRAS